MLADLGRQRRAGSSPASAIVDEHGLGDRAVEIVGQSMVTDMAEHLRRDRGRRWSARDMSAAAARQVYDQAGIGPDDIDVIELHDCFCANELLTYEALRLCARGRGAAS